MQPDNPLSVEAIKELLNPLKNWDFYLFIFLNAAAIVFSILAFTKARKATILVKKKITAQELIQIQYDLELDDLIKYYDLIRIVNKAIKHYYRYVDQIKRTLKKKEEKKLLDDINSAFIVINDSVDRLKPLNISEDKESRYRFRLNTEFTTLNMHISKLIAILN